MIAIDGQYQEGGGQILRSSLAFSAITGKPFCIDKIRAGRKPPGLKAQHLAAVELVGSMCSAQVEGAHPGSTSLTFRPGRLVPGRYGLDVGTAGSVTLLLQAAMLPALFAGGRVELRLVGGTDVSWSPPADYMSQVVLPYFRALGSIREHVGPRGFFPKGKGVLECQVEGRFASWQAVQLPPLDLTRALVPTRIRVHSVSSADLEEREVARRQASSVCNQLADLSPQATFEAVKSRSTGSVVTIWAEGPETDWPLRLGADRLGERGVPAERVGIKAAVAFRERLEQPAPVEENLADNLVPLLALAGGRIGCQVVSPHTLANIYVAEKFTERPIAVEGDELVRS
ncbi:MAG: RNA 3'-terminal phosphate cyclase [Vulcanimicrobiota bacterium]